MDYFHYTDDVNFYKAKSDFFIAVVDKKLTTKNQLLEELANKLRLPNFFGYNWDSLLDCLRDFSWIKSQTIVLFHTVTPCLAETDMATYLEVLKEAVVDWEYDEEHSFQVVFPTSAKQFLEER